jgi:hypothetical protein
VWVEGGDVHDELLDRLGGVLAPPEDLAPTPSAEELEALAAVVAARWPDGAAAPVAGDAEGSPGPAVPGSPVRPLRSGGRRSLRRVGSSAWRAGSVAAGLVLVSGSAAAAANGGVPLPRPVRVVAYTVGLPVDSPALDDTNQHIKELNKAVKAKDTPKAEATVRRLQTDLAKVPADEKKVAVPKVEAAIADATTSGVIQSPAPTTTTTVPPSSTTTATAPASSTTATTAEEKESETEKPAATTRTTDPATTTTTEPTTTTTAPPTDETPSGEDGTGTGDGGSIGDPGPTTSTTMPDTTTTTTAPPPEETTTTTTTEPPTTTTTTSPTTQTATVESSS